MNWVDAGLALAVGFLYDFLNAAFIAAAQRHQPLRAAVMSASVGGLALAGFLDVVGNLAAAPFLLAGYFLGTYVAVRGRR